MALSSNAFMLHEVKFAGQVPTWIGEGCLSGLPSLSLKHLSLELYPVS